MITYREDAEEPHIKWAHVDGPVLVCCNGYMHWLTWWEQIQFWLGLTNLEKFEKKVLKREVELRGDF